MSPGTDSERNETDRPTAEKRLQFCIGNVDEQYREVVLSSLVFSTEDKSSMNIRVIPQAMRRA